MVHGNTKAWPELRKEEEKKVCIYDIQVPTFEPQETDKIWLIIIQVGSYSFMQKHSQDLCWELGVAFGSTQLSA